MLGKDFLTEEDVASTEDNCSVCVAHEKAYEKLKDTPVLYCPNCKDAMLYNYIDTDEKIIYSDDFSKKILDQDFNQGILMECLVCRKNFIISLTPVIWNANHDVYYLKCGE